jgi:hypothetical protein
MMKVTQANAHLRNFADFQLQLIIITFLEAASLKLRTPIALRIRCCTQHTAYSNHVGSSISSYECGASFVVFARTMDFLVCLSSAHKCAYKNEQGIIPMADPNLAGEPFPYQRKSDKPLTPTLTA